MTVARDVDGRVSRPDKVLFPDVGLTKADLARYLARVAPRMLPWVRRRPLALLRFPDGIDGPRFFQKDTPEHLARRIGTVGVPRRRGGSIEQVVVADAADLVVLADQACVELHALLSTADDLEHPVECVIDLDPAGDDPGEVVHAARLLRRALDDAGRPAWAMSSGSRGVHARLPLPPGTSFDASASLAREIGERMVALDPDAVTLETRKAARRGRLFVDTLRNAYGQHAVVPFGVRARPGAPVAVPLRWEEATAAAFDPRRITVANVFRRLAHQRDPWGDRPVPA